MIENLKNIDIFFRYVDAVNIKTPQLRGGELIKV